MMQPGVTAPKPLMVPAPIRDAGAREMQLPVAPGVRQDHTQQFLSLRKSHAERRKKDMPSRLDWLLSIIDTGDAQQLRYFVEAHGQREATEVGETCAYCNARVTSKSGYNADEYRPADRCMICLRWHCQQHCNFVVNLSFSTRQVKLTCCEKCHRTVDVLRWQKDQLPECLSEMHRLMMIAHIELAEQLTTLATAVSQLDGASRSLEQLGVQRDDPAFDEVLPSAVKACQEAMLQSRGTAAAAEAAISRYISELGSLQRDGNPPTGRDLRLRQALVRQSGSQLQLLKLRLKSASTRADQLMGRRR